jgi:hypothetical protein
MSKITNALGKVLGTWYVMSAFLLLLSLVLVAHCSLTNQDRPSEDAQKLLKEIN